MNKRYLCPQCSSPFTVNLGATVICSGGELNQRHEPRALRARDTEVLDDLGPYTGNLPAEDDSLA